MKNILFIAYLYPPIVNSGTRRSLEFVNHLPDYGWNPIVLTVENPAARFCDPALLDEVRVGTLIERVPFWTDTIAERLGNFFNYFIDRERLTEGLKWRFRNFFSIPDECAGWLPTAVRKGIEICHLHKVDVIYATGWPWTAFLIAAEVSRRTNIPCVIDYRDLWKSSGVEWDKRSRIQDLFNPFLENMVLQRAAAVVTTTSRFAETLRGVNTNGKVISITNGFNPVDFAHNPRPGLKSKKGCLRIVYTGVSRPGYGPDDLYRAIKELKNSAECPTQLEVIVAGFPPGLAGEYGIQDIVEEQGPVSHTKAIELMQSADVLYLPVSRGIYETASIPGKLFEYIGSGRPILAVVPEESEVASILAEIGGAFCVEPGNLQKLITSIEALCKMKNDSFFTERRSDVIEQFTRKSLTKKLADLFDSVVDNEK